MTLRKTPASDDGTGLAVPLFPRELSTDTKLERSPDSTERKNRISQSRPEPGDSGAGLEVAAWALFLSLALNTVSAALVPLAAEDDSLTFGGIRVADLFVIFAIAAALLKGIPRGGFFVWGIVATWTVWTMLAALKLGQSEFSLYRNLAEWQLPVYLVAAWLVVNSLPGDRWRTWSRRTVRTQIALIIVASGWTAINGRAGADIATISCVVAMLALAIPRITPKERTAVVLAAVFLVFVSAQRAAILLSLLPLIAAAAIWYVKLNREKASILLTTFLLSSAVLIPFLLAAILDPDVNQKMTQYLHSTFFREAKQLSLESRLVQWEIATSDLENSPILGQGVGGTTVSFRDPGVDHSAITNITHNSFLDFALRFGVPMGGLIIVMLLVLVASRMVAAWKYGYYSLWMCAWAVMGLLAKGMVESVFFKPRLVPLLAVLIAVLLLQRARASGVIQSSGQGGIQAVQGGP